MDALIFTSSPEAQLSIPIPRFTPIFPVGQASRNQTGEWSSLLIALDTVGVMSSLIMAASRTNLRNSQ